MLAYAYRHLDFSQARALLTGYFRDQCGRITKTVVAPPEAHRPLSRPDIRCRAGAALPNSAVPQTAPEATGR